MYKLLVTDVDGTLLDSKFQLLELNKRAILECIESGIGVTIATGKTIDSIRHLIAALNLKLPVITVNGAIISTPSGRVIESVRFPPGIFVDFVRDIRSKGYEPTIATTDGKIFCKKYVENMKTILDAGENLKVVEDLETPFFINNTVSISVPILSSDPLDSYIRKTYRSRLQILRSGEYFFDSINLDASKGRALETIISSLGILKEEVACFGDSHNDISLFESSGLKIAVRNSYPELLEIADIITDENYNSGLGKAIYKYILKKELY